jgi:hypothetical protein
MTAVGQSRRFRLRRATSGLTLETDIVGETGHVGFVPEAETPISFDNLNGLFANTLGDRHPERLCCPQVDAHVE